MSKRILSFLFVFIFSFSVLIAGCTPEEAQEAAKKIAGDLEDYVPPTEEETTVSVTDTAATTTAQQVFCCVSVHGRPLDNLGTEGGGHVSFEPYADDGMIAAGTPVTFFQEAAAGYVFDSWQVWQVTDGTQWGVILESTDPTITVEVNTDTSVDALFRKD